MGAGRTYRRVRIGSKECELLEDSWRSFESAWEGIPILSRWETSTGWVIFSFSGRDGPPDEVIDLLIGEPCDQRGRVL